MKKLIVALLAALLSTAVVSQAQEPDAMTRFIEQLEPLNERMINAINLDNREELESVCMAMIVLYEQQPGNVKEITRPMMGMVWYNVACLRALRGDTDGGVDAFVNAVNNGWDNYTHTMNDSDLDAIRENPRFQEALKRIE